MGEKEIVVTERAGERAKQPYNSLRLAGKFLSHVCSASNGKGHGVHSPFVFDFIKFVLNDSAAYPAYTTMEAERKRLLADSTILEVEDFGAGSRNALSNKRKVGDIARSSLKPKKFAQLLFRMANYYQCNRVLELGTSLGLTTAYFSKADHVDEVLTIEGSAAVAERATETLAHLEAANVRQLIGNFDAIIPELVQTEKPFDLIFIDGNHRYEPTVRYFNHLLSLAIDETIFIFDDIHWSAEMEKAWDEITTDSRVSLSIDLFFIGIIKISKGFKVKQDFRLRY